MRLIAKMLVLVQFATVPVFAESAYFAGMFAQGCSSINRCVEEALAVGRSVCGKLGYRHTVTPARSEEVLVIAGGGAQGSFTWQAPVNCTNAPISDSKPTS